MRLFTLPLDFPPRDGKQDRPELTGIHGWGAFTGRVATYFKMCGIILESLGGVKAEPRRRAIEKYKVTRNPAPNPDS